MLRHHQLAEIALQHLAHIEQGSERGVRSPPALDIVPARACLHAPTSKPCSIGKAQVKGFSSGFDVGEVKHG